MYTSGYRVLVACECGKAKGSNHGWSLQKGAGIVGGKKPRKLVKVNIFFSTYCAYFFYIFYKKIHVLCYYFILFYIKIPSFYVYIYKEIDKRIIHVYPLLRRDIF